MRTQHFILCLSALLLWACGDDGKGPFTTGASYDFATLVSAGPDGSVFTLQQSEDSPLITYTSKESFSPDSQQTFNRRIIIMYTREDGALPYSSGPITLYGYRPLDNKSQAASPDTLPIWQTEPLVMQAITRTGSYVNMQMQLSCMRTATPLRLALLYDKGWGADSLPQLRISYQAAEPGENLMTGYASFSLEPFWATSKGVTIAWMSTSGAKETHTFLK